jgi:hypothetical protein
MTQEFCIHMGHPHLRPADVKEAYDNLGTIIERAKALFQLISSGAEDTGAAESTAYIGEDLCEELERRAKVMLDLAASKKAGKEKTAAELS